MINSIIYKTNQLSNNILLKICEFKDTFWNYGLNSQEKWFKKYVNDTDIHYIIFEDTKIIGYGLRRLVNDYSILDNILVNQNYRNKGYGKDIIEQLLMNTNGIVCLVCSNQNIKFYRKNNFDLIHNIKFNDKNTSQLNIMSKNFDKTKLINLNYYNTR
mgnify:CR=1 FL=1